MPVKLAGELHEIVGRKRAARLVGRMIAPNTRRHAIACVGENKFALRLLLAREFWRAFSTWTWTRAGTRHFARTGEFQ